MVERFVVEKVGLVHAVFAKEWIGRGYSPTEALAGLRRPIRLVIYRVLVEEVLNWIWFHS